MSEDAFYLHFLDPELTGSVNAKMERRLVIDVIKTILIGTTSNLYCGYSALWENWPLIANDFSLFETLQSSRVLDTVSSHPTVNEFLTTRENLYKHDALRYPTYFDEVPVALASYQVTQHNKTNTTNDLALAMLSWGEEYNGESDSPSGELIKTIKHAVVIREGEAITYPYFAKYMQKFNSNSVPEFLVKRKISAEHTRHYLKIGGGSIVTGIPGLSFFDFLSTNSVKNDYGVMRTAILSTPLKCLLTPGKLQNSYVEPQFTWHSSQAHRLFCNTLEAAIISLCGEGRLSANKDNVSYRSLLQKRYSASSFFNSFMDESRCPAIDDIESLFFESTKTLQQSILVNANREILEQFLMIQAEQKISTCDVLLVTATEIETKSIISAAKAKFDITISRHFGKEQVYLDLGKLGGSKVAVVQSEMGSSDPGSSRDTIKDAITELKPSYIVLVGIAFGMADNIDIGDIVVSKQLQCYENQKIVQKEENEEIRLIPRGDKVTASIKLLSLFRSSALDWNNSKIKFGLVLSGDKLIDSLSFKHQLANLFPESIGGEMEGVGLYGASSREKVDWIIVKSVCDFADGNKGKDKEQRQQLAAQNASLFVLSTISNGGFISKT